MVLASVDMASKDWLVRLVWAQKSVAQELEEVQVTRPACNDMDLYRHLSVSVEREIYSTAQLLIRDETASQAISIRGNQEGKYVNPNKLSLTDRSQKVGSSALNYTCFIII